MSEPPPAPSTAEQSTPPRLVLASQSPRRQELLRAAGFDFTIDPADVDESKFPAGMLPADIALHLARMKTDVVARRNADAVVIGADTVVAFGDRMLGKPAGADDARQMLKLLAGTTHIVITGLAMAHIAKGLMRTRRVMSAVRMRPLTPLEIQRYIESGDWMGKAGGYGIQDADPFVKRIAGCHTNIVGLPMTIAAQLLAEAGIFPSPAEA